MPQLCSEAQFGLDSARARYLGLPAKGIGGGEWERRKERRSERPLTSKCFVEKVGAGVS